MLNLEFHQVLRLHALGHEEERHISNHFAGRGHFHDVTKELIDLGVTLLHLSPAVC